MTDYTGLCSRLRARRWKPPGVLQNRSEPVNQDGPEAADAIESLSAENERLAARVAEMERKVAQRDRMSVTSQRFWVRAGKAALAGDARELRNRIDMAEAPPCDVVLSNRPTTDGDTG